MSVVSVTLYTHKKDVIFKGGGLHIGKHVIHFICFRMWIILLLAGCVAADAEADAAHHAVHLGAAPYGHVAAPYCANGG